MPKMEIVPARLEDKDALLQLSEYYGIEVNNDTRGASIA
jgi:hypothetical protein